MTTEEAWAAGWAEGWAVAVGRIARALDGRRAAAERNSFAMASQRLYGEALVAEERARAYGVAAEDVQRIGASTGQPGGKDGG